MSKGEPPLQELPPYPFPGPKPDMSRPDAQALINAEMSLRSALQQAKKDAKGITEAEASLLVREIVYEQRQALAQGLCGGSQEAFCEKYDELNVCDAAAYFAKASGLALCDSLEGFTPSSGYYGKKNYKNIVTDIYTTDLLPSNPYPIPHKFAVAVFPIRKSSGSVEHESYLIDTVFRQFFNPNTKAEHPYPFSRPLLLNTQKTLRPGPYLAQTAEGRRVADTLLRQGYIKLDRQVAKLYLSSLAFGNDIERERRFADVEAKLISPDTLPMKFTGNENDRLSKIYRGMTPKLKVGAMLPETPLNAQIRRMAEAKEGRGR